MTDYQHSLGSPCPIAGGRPLMETFTDHDRPGVYNACIHCHTDQRTTAQKLADLEAEMEADHHG